MTVRLARRIATAAAALCAASVLAACGSQAGGGGGDGRVRVVAGANMWGDIAAQIGGDKVSVTSIVSDPGTDPHEYESDVKDAAAIAKARVVIQNGLSYDDFVKRLVDAGHRGDLALINVAKLVGAADDANPHLWYRPEYVQAAARAIETELAKADPADAQTFEANLQTFLTGYRPVLDTIAAIKAHYAGTAVAYTERVAGYLVQAAGLRLGVPESFARALEEGNDPSPADGEAFTRAVENHGVKVLLYNGQVTNSVTAELRRQAQSSGVPVVSVTEMLPSGKTFQAWQAEQTAALLAALGG